MNISTSREHAQLFEAIKELEQHAYIDTKKTAVFLRAMASAQQEQDWSRVFSEVQELHLDIDVPVVPASMMLNLSEQNEKDFKDLKNKAYIELSQKGHVRRLQTKFFFLMVLYQYYTKLKQEKNEFTLSEDKKVEIIRDLAALLLSSNKTEKEQQTILKIQELLKEV